MTFGLFSFIPLRYSGWNLIGPGNRSLWMTFCIHKFPEYFKLLI
uniref:Uncharacterized protein n=1 Tax=Anguilla anguilla TaxID=7936 RepID=A0A0E9UR09_ANGAN